MKKFVAFAFAAVAAVGFGGDVPSSWYTPSGGYSTQMTETWYIKTVGKQTLKYRCECKWVNDNDGGHFAYIWDYPPGEPDAATAAAIEKALTSEYLANISSEEILQLAQTVYDNAITKIEPDGNGGYKYYTSNGGGGRNPSPAGTIKMPEYTIKKQGNTYRLSKNNAGTAEGESWKILSYEAAYDSTTGKYYITDDDGTHKGLAWAPGQIPDDTSVQSFISGSDIKFQIYGWDVASAYGDSLAKRLTDGGDNALIPVRNNSGNLSYMSLGKIEFETGGCGEADESSITTNATGNVGKMSLYGFHDEGTETGAIPARNSSGKLAWVNPDDTDGAILISHNGNVPTFTSTESMARYYGTPKAAEASALGNANLGWHELPNVTTNYVQGDERTTTTTQKMVDGEICKVLKLVSEPSGGATAGSLPIYGARMDSSTDNEEPKLVWEQICGAAVAPTIPDRITITNNTSGPLQGTVSIAGFAAAEDGTFLSRKSANAVEWKYAITEAAYGLETANGIVGIENYTMSTTEDFADKIGDEKYCIIGRKRTDHEDPSGVVTGSTYSVELVGMENVIPYDDHTIATNENGELCVHGFSSAQKNGEIPAKTGDHITWTGADAPRMYYGTGDDASYMSWHSLDSYIPSEEYLESLKTKVVGFGDIDVTEITDPTFTGKVYQVSIESSGTDTNYYCYAVDGLGNMLFQENDYIVNKAVESASDIFVQKSGDTMTGDLDIEASLSADSITALGSCYLPYPDSVYVQYATNETGEALYTDLDLYVDTAAELTALEVAKEEVKNATNALSSALSSAFKTFSLTVEGDANLPGFNNTKIGGCYPITVESGNEAITMYINGTNLIIKQNNVNYYVPMIMGEPPTP